MRVVSKKLDAVHMLLRLSEDEKEITVMENNTENGVVKIEDAVKIHLTQQTSYAYEAQVKNHSFICGGKALLLADLCSDLKVEYICQKQDCVTE